MTELIYADDKLVKDTKILIDNFANSRVLAIKESDPYDQRFERSGVRSSQIAMLLEILVDANIIQINHETKSIDVNRVK